LRRYTLPWFISEAPAETYEDYLNFLVQVVQTQTTAAYFLAEIYFYRIVNPEAY
jgi:hypothetical protein